jgi:hypothetical protein
MSYNPAFMGVDNIGSTLIINELENNYKSFLDWGFLNIGAFTNVKIPTTNISNFDLHILKSTTDKNQTQNTVWQAPRKDWVYETGVSYNSTVPIEISGIYVNGTLYPAPTGNSTLGYRINYPEGKVIFNKSVPSSSVVQAEYSYRNIQVYKMEEFPYWKEIQHKSLENKLGLSLSDKGTFAINSEHRVQLPTIVIETIARSNSKPFRLGDKSLIIEQDILLHILSDQPTDKNNIIDIIRLQEDREIWLYNTNEVIKNNLYPLNYNGSKNTSGQNYFNIINNSNLRWLKCRIIDINISDINFTNIRMYGSVVRLTNEIIYTNMLCSPCSSLSLPSEPINLEVSVFS